jgi:N-acetylgalactosamine kinase
MYVKAATEWQERATGDVKLLQSRSGGKTRVLMRQEKMLYIRANHLVPDVDLAPMAGSDKAWVWNAVDFGIEAAGKQDTFAVKFKDAEMAKEFKAAWDAGRAANKAGGAPAAAPAAAAAAAAAPAPAADTSGPIPVAESLDTIYGADKGSEMGIRYGHISEAFAAAYGCEPSFFVRAPGRVNLIGEHIDYHGYSVLPMALQTQDVVIAVGVAAESSSSDVQVANVNPRWETGSLPLDPSVEVNRAVHKWYNYVHCGYKGAFDVGRAKGVAGAPKALRLMIDGAVPPGAGVSSSSALVVASLLAVARANGISDSLSRADLGEAGRACELHIGTMSGGMDQAISAMGIAGSASRVDFEPLSAHSVALPADAAFVVSNTLEVSAKAEEAEKRYNMRVTEGMLAAKLVAKGEGLAQWRSIGTFRQLQETLKLASPGALVPAIEKHIKAGAYSQTALVAADSIGEDLAGLFEGSPSRKRGALKVLAAFGVDEPAFELLKRARHVCSEAERVWQFQYAAEGKGVEGGPEVQLARLGELMCASQSSCRDDYECSSPGLDALCKIAMDAGAYGSRLTGAGWGGCAVSLVHRTKVDAFKAALAAAYPAYAGKDQAFVDNSLFASAPGSGAAVYTPASSFSI